MIVSTATDGTWKRRDADFLQEIRTESSVILADEIEKVLYSIKEANDSAGIIVYFKRFRSDTCLRTKIIGSVAQVGKVAFALPLFSRTYEVQLEELIRTNEYSHNPGTFKLTLKASIPSRASHNLLHEGGIYDKKFYHVTQILHLGMGVTALML